MDKEEIIECVESHSLKLDLDRWNDKYKEWMRFLPINSNLNEHFVIFKPELSGNERKDRNHINMECSKYWRNVGSAEKKYEIRKILGIDK